MCTIAWPFRWFYREFGLVSIYDSGRNVYLIILARACRMFAYGTNALILAIFFSALEFSDHWIGIFMTLTLLGDVLLGTFLTLIADRIGRRKVMMGGSFLMIASGAIFAVFENFWILLIAAVFGVISVTGGDFGPFRSIEESVLSQLTTPSTRSDVLTWYITTSTLGSSIGSEVSGQIVHFLQDLDGWTEIDAYHAIFWIYSIMGFINAVFVFFLTDTCELQEAEKSYVQVPQDESEHVETTHQRDAPQLPEPVAPSKKGWLGKGRSWFTSRLTQISKPTRSVMYKLWFLLAVDSLADGMVPYTLTNYYMDIKFHPATSTLGNVTSVSYFMGAVASVFASPLSRRIGLVNTMVFTHVPSSAAVLIFPFPPAFWMAAGLLLVRATLNNMDQAPRTAFIAAVVRPEERTAVMGITSMARTVAAMGGPTLTGLLAANEQFWIAFVVAGVCRLAYDFGLYAMFVNMKLYQNEAQPEDAAVGHDSRRQDDEEMEMQSLVDSDSMSEADDNSKTVVEDVTNSGLQPPQRKGRARSRSPHRSNVYL